MIIDNHTHLESTDQLNYYKKQIKTTNFKVISFDSDHREKLAGLITLAKKHKEILPVGTVRFNKPNIKQQLSILEKHFKNKEIYGIKLYPGYQHFYPSDKRVDAVAKLCQKYNKPLVFHSGDVWDEDGTALLKYAHPIHIDELAIRNPNCNIIISHFGFPYFMDTANIVSKNNNVYTDVSGTITEMNNNTDLNNIFNQYKVDLLRAFNYFPEVRNKTMFGTDFCGQNSYLPHISIYKKLLTQLLSTKQQKSAFHDLAKKLYL